MAKLDGLIRYQKWELDAKRRELASLEAEREEIVARIDRMMAEFDNETANSDHHTATLMMGTYANGVRRRREEMEAEIVEKDKLLDVARDKVTEAFQELKTYEVAHENRLKAERKEENRIEGLMLDEQGLQGHSRKQKK